MGLLENFVGWITENRPPEDHIKAIDGKVKIHKVITAEQAYSVAKYNQVKTQADLVASFMNSTMKLIESKQNNNEFCCQVELNKDIRELAPKIIDYFRNKLGFKVVYMDEKTEIKNNGFGDDLKSEIPENSAFLAIFWKNIKLKSMIDKNEKGEDTDFEECINYLTD